MSNCQQWQCICNLAYSPAFLILPILTRPWDFESGLVPNSRIFRCFDPSPIAGFPILTWNYNNATIYDRQVNIAATLCVCLSLIVTLCVCLCEGYKHMMVCIYTEKSRVTCTNAQNMHAVCKGILMVTCLIFWKFVVTWYHSIAYKAACCHGVRGHAVQPVTREHNYVLRELQFDCRCAIPSRCSRLGDKSQPRTTEAMNVSHVKKLTSHMQKRHWWLEVLDFKLSS